MLQSIDPNSLRQHIGHLRHAVVTTTCRETSGVLRRMLEEAEAELRNKEPGAGSSNKSI